MGNSSSAPTVDNRDDNTEYEELCLLLVTLEFAAWHLQEQESMITVLLQQIRSDERLQVNRDNRTNEKEKPKRKSFSEITNYLSERLFRRMFRIRRTSFFKLCGIIGDKVGDDDFKSEKNTRTPIKTDDATSFRGGEISGELCMGVFLRLLAGSSYLDLFMIYGMCPSSVYNSFHKSTIWINNTLEFPLVQALQDENTQYFEELSRAFSYDSEGTYNGCIGALDGVVLQIKRPSLTEILRDPGAYFCRKEYFALNCQAIFDVKKRIIWLSSRHIGSCHDSRAFTDTQLYELLLEKKEYLRRNEFFFVGDSAYDLESFLLIPFENAEPQSDKDAYNYYYSNYRIRIECTFGELIMRFGLFWRTLKMNLEDVGDIVNAAALLHNFIVDEREGDNVDGFEDSAFFELFSDNLIQSLDEPVIPMTNIRRVETPHVVVTDNNEPNPGGRPTSEKSA